MRACARCRSAFDPSTKSRLCMTANAQVIDREQYVRDAYGGEVAVCRSILEGVSQKLVALGGQSGEDALPIAEVVTRRGMADTQFHSQGAKAQLIDAVACDYFC